MNKQMNKQTNDLLVPQMRATELVMKLEDEKRQMNEQMNEQTSKRTNKQTQTNKPSILFLRCERQSWK